VYQGYCICLPGYTVIYTMVGSVCLCVRSCVALVGCVCNLACDVGDNEM